MATINKEFKHDENIKNIIAQVAVAYKQFNAYTKDVKDEDLLEQAHQVDMLFCEIVSHLANIDSYLYTEDIVNYANGNDVISAIEHAKM